MDNGYLYYDPDFRCDKEETWKETRTSDKLHSASRWWEASLNLALPFEEPFDFPFLPVLHTNNLQEIVVFKKSILHLVSPQWQTENTQNVFLYV